MGWTVSTIAVLVFGSGLVATSVGLFAFRKRPDPMAWPMTALMGTIAIWALFDAVSMANTSSGWLFFWTKLTQPPSTLAPVAYFVVALNYAGYERWCTWRVYVGLAVVPIVSVLLAWGYPATELYWAGHETTTVYGAAVLVTEQGPVNWLLLGYAYLVTIGALFLFGSVAIRSGTIHRKQSLLMFAGGLVPLVINVAFNAGFSPVTSLDFTTMALTVSGGTFAAVLFYYQTLELSPAAYRNVSALFGDGVVVFDDERRLVEANGYAEEILGTELSLRASAESVFDQPLSTLDGTVLESPGGTNRFYNLRYSPLRNYQDDVVGHVVVMREITELKTHQQRLDVTNRILRHNLRNELTVILGEIERLESQDGVDDHLGQIRGVLDRLMDASEKARDIQSSLHDDAEPHPVDLVPLASSVVERYDDVYPDATVQCTVPEAARVLTTDESALEIVVKNLVENGLEHNDADRPRVEVTVEPQDETVLIRVADNGPGLPPEERQVLERGRETKLDHGSGLGLWLVYWFVTGMDGEIEFAENDPRGTIVTIRLDAATRRHEPSAQAQE